MPGFWFVFRFGGFLHCVESKFEVRLRRPPTILTSNYVALPLSIAYSNLVRIVGRVKLIGHGVRSSIAAPISGRYFLFAADATGHPRGFAAVIQVGGRPRRLPRPVARHSRTAIRLFQPGARAPGAATLPAGVGPIEEARARRSSDGSAE